MTTMDGQAHDVGKWDMLIAHPPCTYLTAASAVRLFNKDHTVKDWERERKGWEARRLFLQMLCSGVEKLLSRIRVHYGGSGCRSIARLLNRTCSATRGKAHMTLAAECAPAGANGNCEAGRAVGM